MGQRLVITVHAFDEDIATIYYHWSAYTTSAPVSYTHLTLPTIRLV